MKIAFYKASGSLFDKVIRFWENGPFSHCEVILSGPDVSGNFEIASSEPGVGVRITTKPLPSSDWEILEVEGDIDQVRAWFKQHDGAAYDYVGILGFVFRPVPQGKRKFFCSEAIGRALGIIDAWRYDPNALYSTLSYKVT